MFVLTIDQQGSRQVGDRVPEFLRTVGDALAHVTGVVRPFERTVGDEVQAVFDDPGLAVEVALDVLRRGGWSVGIGAGPVDTPLPATARAGSGPAFVLARAAVEAAKSRQRSVALTVRGSDSDRAQDAEAVLVLLAALRARRTQPGWAVVDAVTRAGGTVRQEDLAHSLGVSQQAVSQRLRTALWAEEHAALPLTARLLAQAAAVSQDGARLPDGAGRQEEAGRQAGARLPGAAAHQDGARRATAEPDGSIDGGAR
jgi:hypothetical protein